MLPEVNVNIAMPPDDDHVTIVYRKPFMDSAQVFAYAVVPVSGLAEAQAHIEDAQRRGYNPFQENGPRPLPKGVVDITERRKK